MWKIDIQIIFSAFGVGPSTFFDHIFCLAIGFRCVRRAEE